RQATAGQTFAAGFVRGFGHCRTPIKKGPAIAGPLGGWVENLALKNPQGPNDFGALRDDQKPASVLPQDTKKLIL
ncbi:MAG: hypothetical protein ACKVJQ_10335, partial [Alphaproteobacteria bacterium]